MQSELALSTPLYSPLAEDPDLADLVTLFVDEMPDRIAGLLARLEQGDWEGLRRLAHQLKGAAGSYGFTPITPMAGRVEHAIRNGQPEEQIRQSVGELIALCRQARAGQPDDSPSAA